MKLTLIVPGLLARPADALAATPALNDLALFSGPAALAFHANKLPDIG